MALSPYFPSTPLLLPLPETPFPLCPVWLLPPHPSRLRSRWTPPGSLPDPCQSPRLSCDLPGDHYPLRVSLAPGGQLLGKQDLLLRGWADHFLHNPFKNNTSCFFKLFAPTNSCKPPRSTGVEECRFTAKFRGTGWVCASPMPGVTARPLTCRPRTALIGSCGPGS